MPRRTPRPDYGFSPMKAALIVAGAVVVVWGAVMAALFLAEPQAAPPPARKVAVSTGPNVFVTAVFNNDPLSQARCS